MGCYQRVAYTESKRNTGYVLLEGVRACHETDSEGCSSRRACVAIEKCGHREILFGETTE